MDGEHGDPAHLTEPSPRDQQNFEDEKMSLGNSAVSEEPSPTVGNGDAKTKSVSASIPAGASQPDPYAEQVQAVVNSEIGVQTLLNRLKQSIASAKEFALFLKKRSTLEEEHANGLRKIVRITHDNLQRPEHRQGSFLQSYAEITRIQDHMADNGLLFAGSLQQMHEDLLEMAANMERGRKHWKQVGISAEQRLQETEGAMRKSKAKYDAVADDYERVRTGDRQSGKKFGLKGPKSAAQHEEDLLRKLQAHDADYAAKVQSAQTGRAELFTRGRPEAVKGIQDLVRECDSALTLQMQKYATFNEKLLLHNGISISPLKKGAEGGKEGRSLRDIISGINNEIDMSSFIASHSTKIPPQHPEPKYVRAAALNPQSAAPQVQRQSEPVQNTPSSRQGPPPQAGGPGAPGSFQVQQQQYSSGPGPAGQNQPIDQRSPMGQNPMDQNPIRSNTMGLSPVGQNPLGQNSMNQSPMSGRGAPQNFNQGPPPPQQFQQHERTFSFGQQPKPPTSQYNTNSIGRNGPGPNTSSYSSSGPPQLGTLPFQNAQNTQPQQSSFQQPPPQTYQQGPVNPPMQRNAPQNNYQSQPPLAMNGGGNQLPPPLKPVFGMSLDQLFERDGSAVPMVVYQCITAVDLFGLEVEGIYRLSGTSSHVTKIKAMFDNDASKVDFRNPENFVHDVNSVAGLLKQFFRDLPDPLLTAEHYQGFIDSAKIDDDIMRRDSLHAIINALPDPNYATLRALTLHLNRVQENSAVNRMNASNLAIVFGPTLMGANTGPNIQDAGWQVRVIDTILANTYQIFDDD